jgi:hypothetical protein
MEENYTNQYEKMLSTKQLKILDAELLEKKEKLQL